jgi:hypothetical protein
MAHGPSLFSGHFAGPIRFSGNPPAPIPPTRPLRPWLIPPRIQTQTEGSEPEVIEDPPPWEDFAKWSDLGQQNQQQAIDQLEAQMKWGPRVGTTAALLTPFPFGVIPAGVGTSVGMGAAEALYGIQHGPPTKMFSPQWSFLSALNPFGVSPANQLSRNVMDLESAWLASPPSAPPGWSGPGWSGSGIPDDIQIEYGGSRSEGEIRDLINAARAESEGESGLGGYGGYGEMGGGAGADVLDAQEAAAAQGWEDPTFNTGGPVTADRGLWPRPPSNVRRGLGSLADAPWGDLARMDLSRLGRRW